MPESILSAKHTTKYCICEHLHETLLESPGQISIIDWRFLKYVHEVQDGERGRLDESFG